jgi:hypothetical protein
MKIRNGFVANSSSSSFCLLGIPIDKDMLPYELQEYWDDQPSEVLYPLLHNTGLTWEKEEDPAGGFKFYIGKSVQDLDQKRSIEENKMSIKKQIAKLLNMPEKEVEVDFITGCLYA